GDADGLNRWRITGDGTLVDTGRRCIVGDAVATTYRRLAPFERVPREADARRDIAVVLPGDLAAVGRIFVGDAEAVQSIACARYQVARSIHLRRFGRIE